MSRLDIAGDARRTINVIKAGGIAIVPNDTGYACCGASMDPLKKIYDTKRTPSWCDRVLFHAQTPSKLAVLKYWDVDCYQSDHKPVCAAFKVLLKKEDADRKKKLLQIYMEQVE